MEVKNIMQELMNKSYVKHTHLGQEYSDFSRSRAKFALANQLMGSKVIKYIYNINLSTMLQIYSYKGVCITQ